MMMTDDPILKTIEKLVSLYEGVAEYVGPNILEVMLTDQVAKTLEVEEEIAFTTSADVRNGYFVTYNSEIFNKFEALLGQKGYVATFGVKYEGYLKTTGFDKLVTESLHPQNGLIRVIEAKRENTPYVLCNVAYTASADEKRLGMVSFFVNELTGVAPVEVGDALLWESDRIEVSEEENQIAVDLEKIEKVIEKTSECLIEQDLEKWVKSLQPKHSRDEERLKAYYGAIAQEIQRKMIKKHLEGEAEEKE